MVADVVCPYCYIGYKHLQDALQKVRERRLPVDVQVEYTPFILRRHLPKEGIDKLSMFAQNFGGESQARHVFEGIKQNAAKAGLCINVDGQRAGNSEDAHRLLAWARSSGKELTLFESMMKAYNCEQGWLGEHDVLTRSAITCGLPEDEVRQVLADPSLSLDILEDGLRRSKKLGVSGVPFFVVNDRQTFSGALDSQKLLRIFESYITSTSEEL